jgi:uncharacterized protein YbaA (DUF1428 family)
MSDIDGSTLPVPRRNIAAYRLMAQRREKSGREHRALDFKECADDDLNVKFEAPFPRIIRLKSGETMNEKSMSFERQCMKVDSGVISLASYIFCRLSPLLYLVCGSHPVT